MVIKNYEDLNSLEIDTLREIGSIGTGNAATALSGMLGCPVHITLPEVRIMGYNEAIDWIGGPEPVTAGVLVHIGSRCSRWNLSTPFWAKCFPTPLRNMASWMSCSGLRWWRWAIL